MTKGVWLARLFLALVLVGLSCTSVLALEDMQETRQAAWETWLTDVRRVIQVINDNATLNIWRKFENAAVLGAPLDDGDVKAPDGSAGKVVVVPILREDVGTDGPWRSKAIGSVAVDFSPRFNAISVKTSVLYGPEAKTLALLPTIFFYQQSKEEPFDHNDKETLLSRQVEMVEFRNRLMMQLGGKKYSGMLKQELFLLALDLSKKGGQWEFDLVEKLKYDDQLRTVFEEPASEDERIFLQTAFFTNAVFYFCDRNAVADGIGKKKALLQSLPKPVNRMGF